jgi:hypothetical protein
MANVPPDKLRIGRALLAGGPLTVEFLESELERSNKQGSVLGKALLQSGFPREEDLIVTVLQQLRIPKINAKNTKIPLETIRLLPQEVAIRCRVLPIDQIGTILVVVTPDIGNTEGLAEVRKVTGSLVTPIQCSEQGFEAIVNDYYRRLSDSGLQPAAPVGAQAASGSQPVGTNGAVRAIPVGAEGEDSFFKRFMTSGPVPAVEESL